ncbi:chromosome segregation protein [Tenacibaculum holothuriorum]|uniref:Chromosome segregation protein n=1 Tax=Tenacibaculum holothuriorum TaxID=1635173 RepID=A0A1Y2PD81_9FLAO|nr:DUF349 domain-containing protein [Tenacibaculum holothuriorum]OSY87971.1 chromosome segregation protein [Tenacibaculum holothuriorum]
MLDNNDESVEQTTNTNSQELNEVEKAVDVVENEVAQDAEKEDEKHQIPMLDYASMDLEKLVTELSKLLKAHPVQQLKANVDAIKNSFNAKFGKLLAEKKEAFLAEGGNTIDFQYSNPTKIEYNKLLGEYKSKRDTYYSQLEKQLKENLEKRVTLIEELKNLITNADPKTMYNDFQQIQNRWKSVGPVPKTRYNDTWKTYHHHVERFYDLLHLNKDFRELDFKHNLEEKIKLIDRAEALANVKDVNVAFKELQLLHKMWKEEIGPVSKEHREEVWTRFSTATKKIHDKRHEYFRQLKSKYQDMIDAKLEVVAEINAYDTSGNKTHNDWQKSINEIEALRKKYFDIGKLPYNRSEAVWQQFKAATKKFNTSKNSFYKSEKSAQSSNLKQKMALVELAESIKDSEDWNETTNTMKRIQADWKKIGHVPRKYSDDIWNRFKNACNYYFDRLHAHKNELNKEQQAVVDTKKEFLDEFKAQEGVTLEQVQEAMSKWKELGFLPRNARHLDGKFNKAIDSHLEKLNLGREDIEMMKFKNIVDTYLSQEDYRKLDSEQLFIRRKIDETVREMQQLENNLSFISNATEDNPLVKNVRAGIQEFKNELDIWQLKLDYLKKLDY